MVDSVTPNDRHFASLLRDAARRLGRPVEGVLDMHGFADVTALAAEINAVGRQLGLPTMFEFAPIDDSGRTYRVKVSDLARPKGTGIQTGVFHGFVLSDDDRLANAINIPTICSYLIRNADTVEAGIAKTLNKRAKAKRRGRPADTDAKADKRIAEAWATGRYTTYKQLDVALNLKEGEAKRAIDRHRKRKTAKSKRKKSSAK